MDCLPLEILQQVFINLELTDLLNSAKVCLIWREVANSNRIWLNLCLKNGIENKTFLEDEYRLVYNPSMHFREVDPSSHRFSPACHWKLHFIMYKYLEYNWRYGRFTKLKTSFSVTYYKDRIAVGVISTSLMKLFDVNEQAHIRNLANSFESRVSLEVSVPMEYPDLEVDKIFVLKELVFYVKKYYIICIKINGKSFETIYSVKIKNSKRLHKNSITRDSKRLMVHFTSRYIIVIDVKHPCKLLICNINTGEIEKEVDINFCGKPLGVCIKPHCMTVHDDNVFISLTCDTKHFVACYDIAKSAWFLTLDLEDQAFELTASKRFLCAKKFVPANLKVCELHVFPLNFQDRMQFFIGNKFSPVVLTEDDKIIFSDDITLHVRSLNEYSCIDHSIKTNAKVEKIIPILNNAVLINNSTSLQVWDWKRPDRMQTFIRINIDSLWADDSTAVVNCSEDRKGTILSFW